MSIDKSTDLTPEEQELMNGRADDNEAAEVAAATAAAATEAAAVVAADEAGAPAADVATAADGEAAAAPQTPAPEAAATPQYDVPTTDFATKRAEFKTAKSEAFIQWQAGDLDDAAYQGKVSDLDDQMLTLATEQARAETVKQINEQNLRDATEKAAKAENEVLGAIAKASKAANLIDYGADTLAAETFDALFTIAKRTPANAGKSLKDVASEVHDTMLTMRGLKTTAAPAAAGDKRAARVMPPTLGDMPTAAAQPVGQALSDELDQITDPDVMDARWAALPQAQRTAMLRETMPTKRGRH